MQFDKVEFETSEGKYIITDCSVTPYAKIQNKDFKCDYWYENEIVSELKDVSICFEKCIFIDKEGNEQIVSEYDKKTMKDCKTFFMNDYKDELEEDEDVVEWEPNYDY